MDEFKTEKWTLDDGRRAERRVMESISENGQSERIVELHVEDERPLKLQQRVVEKSKPIVYERKVETMDPQTGSVVDQKVESIEPKVQMHLVEHVVSSNVSTQSVSDNCPITKDEMIETIIAAIKATREAPVEEKRDNANFSDRLNSLGLADEIAGRVKSEGTSVMDKILFAVIAAQIVGLGYMILFM
jgi:hypothetical protein